MEKRFANLLSYVTHPLLTPLLGLLVISNSGTYAADLDPRFSHFIYLAVFVLTFLLPVTLIPFLLYMDLAKTLHFHERKERLMPLYVTLVFYIAAYFLVKKLPISEVYQRYLFSASLSVLFVLVISYFWKISSHLTGWGGLVGLIFSLSIRFDSDLMLFLIVSILITGLVGFARLRLGAHDTLQIYSGFLMGFLTMLIVFFI